MIWSSEQASPNVPDANASLRTEMKFKSSILTLKLSLDRLIDKIADFYQMAWLNPEKHTGLHFRINADQFYFDQVQ